MNQVPENSENVDSASHSTHIKEGNYNENINGNVVHVAGDYIQQPKAVPESQVSSSVDIKTLVTQLRKQVHADMEARCGTMRILDMSQPVGLEDIYTKVNILEKISGRRRKDIADLISNCDLENFNRFNFGEVTGKIAGKDAVSKYRTLLVLGKPGA